MVSKNKNIIFLNHRIIIRSRGNNTNTIAYYIILFIAK